MEVGINGRSGQVVPVHVEEVYELVWDTVQTQGEQATAFEVPLLWHENKKAVGYYKLLDDTIIRLIDQSFLLNV